LINRIKKEGERRGPVRVGVIGAGFGSVVHIPALQRVPGTEVAAIVARRAERAHVAAAQYGVPQALTDFRELLRDPAIDAVVVATPPYLHHTMVISAVDAGKHVLCEKPMARNLAEARDMEKIAANAGVAAMVNHEFRFSPVRMRVKQLIDEGFIGEPQSASFTVFRSSLNDPGGIPFNWLMEQDKAGGMLGAVGSHHVDALRWWFGEVKAVAGAVSTMVKRRRLPESMQLAPVDADDNFSVLLKFANGALGSIHYTATAAVELSDQIILSGSDGMLMIANDNRLYGGRREDGLRELDAPEPEAAFDATFDHPLAYPTMLLHREWINAIRTGEPASPSFADGVKVQEILDGALRSSQQGRWVEIVKNRFQLI
jgi:predicted dehydrogenase